MAVTYATPDQDRLYKAFTQSSVNLGGGTTGLPLYEQLINPEVMKAILGGQPITNDLRRMQSEFNAGNIGSFKGGLSNYTMPLLSYGTKKNTPNPSASSPYIGANYAIQENNPFKGYVDITPPNADGTKPLPIGVPLPNMKGGVYDPNIDPLGNLYSGIGGPTDYSYLYDTVQGSDGVYSSSSNSLPSQAYKFSDIYKPAPNTSDQYFGDYLSAIGAPSSVDAVRSGLENELLQSTFKDIDEQTARDIGSLKLDFLERGIGGPGQISDIEANALALASASGGKNKANARLQLGLAELDRQKARETAQREAYGQRYAAGVGQEQQAKDIAAKGALTDVGTLNELLGLQFRGGESALDRTLEGKKTAATLGSAEKRSLLDNLIQYSLGKEKLGQFYDALDAEQENALLNSLYSGNYGKSGSEIDPFISGLMNIGTSAIGGIGSGIGQGIATGLSSGIGNRIGASFVPKEKNEVNSNIPSTASVYSTYTPIGYQSPKKSFWRDPYRLDLTSKGLDVLKNALMLGR